MSASAKSKSAAKGRNPDRLTVKQVAALLNCSHDLVRELIRNKSLPAVDLAAPGAKQAAYRVWRKDLEAFEQRHKE